MKELSIEEKARAYDEVCEKITIRFGSNVADEIFSQFEMSDDERIRKCLLSHFSRYQQQEVFLNNITMGNIVSWLEKQGEQKPDEIDEEIAAAMKGVGTLELVDGIAHCTNKKGVIPPKEESGVLGTMIDKQNPVKWSEEDEEAVLKLTSFIEDWFMMAKGEKALKDCVLWSSDPELYERLLHFLKSLRFQPKRKWGEEDKKMRNRAIFACNLTMDRTHSEGHHLYQEAIDWLKALPIGFITNPNYNEDMVELLVGELRHIADENKAPKQFDKEIEWLKSLRPQKQWKPSDAQMASITCAVRKMKESACYDSELVSLLNDLKKLKEG